jgi:hypothetical protein
MTLLDMRVKPTSAYCERTWISRAADSLRQWHDSMHPRPEDLGQRASLESPAVRAWRYLEAYPFAAILANNVYVSSVWPFNLTAYAVDSGA